MIAEAVLYVQQIVSSYGAWGVFAATIFEEVFAPIPSPIVALSAGFFLLDAFIPWQKALLESMLLIGFPVSVGITLGSLVVYGIGFYGGKPLIEKMKSWLDLEWRDVERAEEVFRRSKRDEVALFILRLIPLVPGVAISGLSGVVRYPLGRFLLITTAGAFFRATLLGLLGWQAGSLYQEYATGIDHIEKYLFGGTILFLLVFFFRKRLKMTGDL